MSWEAWLWMAWGSAYVGCFVGVIWMTEAQARRVDRIAGNSDWRTRMSIGLSG